MLVFEIKIYFSLQIHVIYDEKFLSLIFKKIKKIKNLKNYILFMIKILCHK